MKIRKLSVIVSLFAAVMILVTACAPAATPPPAATQPPAAAETEVMAEPTEAPAAAETEAMAEPTEPPAAAETEAMAEPAEPPKPEKLTFWMMKIFVDTGNESVQAHVEEFTKETGIPVDFELIPINDLSTRWSAAIESGNVPDLSYFDYNNLGQFHGQDLLLDVTDTVDAIQAKNGDLTPALLRSMTYDGRLYGVPMWAEPTVLYYRTDLFEKAGIANPPDTWDEFIADAKLLTDPANGVYGAGFGIGMNLTDSEWWFRDIIWSHGASLVAEDGVTAKADTPEFKQAAQFITDFYTTDNVTPPGVVGWDDAGNNKSYLSGQSAMIINTGSVYNAIFNTSDYPDLKETTKLALVPAGPAGRFVTGICNGMGIFKATQNPYWAQQLMMWMMDKEWQREWMQFGGYQIVPAYPDLAEDPFWQNDYGRVFGEVPQYYAFIGYPGPFTPAAGEVSNTFQLTSHFMEVVVNNQPLDEMLAKLQEDLTAIFQQ
jgi:ABC-type glycerol-3-phosphate transport system substrate-binding protein